MIGYVIFMILTVIYLFKKTSVQEENGNFDALQDLGEIPVEVLDFEAKVRNNDRIF